MIGTGKINSFIRVVSLRPCLVTIGILGTLALFVLARAYPNFPGDEQAILGLQGLRTPWLDDVVVWFANLKLVWIFLLAVAALSGGLLLSRRYDDVAIVVATLPVVGIGFGLKLLVDRPRPEYQMFGPIHTDPSFPSGHALLAVIFGGILVYLVERSVKPMALRRTIQVALFMAVISIGISRVYMGVHWPSDVIGSYLFGVMALMGLVRLRNLLASTR